MNHASADSLRTRERPEVLRLPPARMTLACIRREALRTTVVAYLAGGAGLLVLGLIFRYLLASTGLPWPAEFVRLLTWLGVALLLSPLGLFAAALAAAWEMNLGVRRARERMFAAHPGLKDDARVQCLTAQREAGRGRPVELARMILETAPHADSAFIVCLEEAEPADVPDASVEPIVVAAGGDMLTRVIGVIAAYLFGASVCLALVGRIRHPLTHLLGGGAVVAAMIALWRSRLRPTYLRIAPGAIQILRFGLFATRPRITNVPMDRGTVVFVRALKRGPQWWRLTVCRDGACQELRFTVTDEVRHAAIWQALLSSARTPPLSNEALVG